MQTDDFIARVQEVKRQFDFIAKLAEPENTNARIAEIEGLMAAEDFWNDPKKAATISGEHTRLKRKLDNLESLRTEVENVETFLEMAKDAGDADRAELLSDLEQELRPLSTKLGQLQEDTLFSGEYDNGNAIVSIHSGEGGVDAQDWAEMLLRMYTRFWERRGFKVQQTDETRGDEAGIRSASFTVEGENAYGLMNAEAGVHRLVRLSPFDSANRRQTSFAQLEVSPLIEDDVELDINDDDIRVDTYRASGAGGQHVNKTSSAVRMTHVPSGVVVQCQNERSQIQNRETAMKMLRAKLFEIELRKREAAIAAEKGEAQNVGFGSQIRSYVLHPYQMVKDLRTRHETGNVQAVLDGALDDFIRDYLLQKATGTLGSGE
jgi:peptide chain release factor 2